MHIVRKHILQKNYIDYSLIVINLGFERKGLGKYIRDQKLQYIDKNYGKHCYGGGGEYKDNDYRGGGFIHLTHFSTYQSCYNYTGLDILKHPEILENNYLAAIESALWFWNIYNKNRSYSG